MTRGEGLFLDKGNNYSCRVYHVKVRIKRVEKE